MNSPDPQVNGPATANGCSHSRLALRAAGVGTFLWDLATGEVEWDEATFGLFGVDPASFVPSALTIGPLIHPEDQQWLDAQTKSCIGCGAEFNWEYRIIWPKDGSVHYLRSRGKVVRSPNGSPTNLVGASWDITERRSLQTELDHERFLLRALLENLPDRIYFKDTSSRFIRVSSELARSFGVTSQADMLGKTDFDFFSDEHARQAWDDEQRILTTGQPLRNLEERETWPDGRETWAVTTKVPLRNPTGKIIGTFGISRDITDRRRAEEQVAKYMEELRRRNRELEEDLEMARELQGALMPRHYPIFAAGPAAESALRFSHIFNPSSVVSGDFFDIIKLSDTAAGIFICDVMGHGVRAALVAAIIRALITELNGLAQHPGEFLAKLNEKLYAILSQAQIPMFASASYVIADIAKGELRFANAGHPEPLCIRHDSAAPKALSLHESGRGPVLGMFATPAYGTSRTPLSVRDVVLQFTDGLYEIEGAGGELYDERCLFQAVNRRANLGPGDLCREVLAEIRQLAANQQFSDDVCLVAVEVERILAA